MRNLIIYAGHALRVDYARLRSREIAETVMVRWPVDAIPYSISHFQNSTFHFIFPFSLKNRLYNYYTARSLRRPREATPSFRKLIISYVDVGNPNPTIVGQV